MLGQRLLPDFRAAMRPLAWLAACAVAMSTSHAHAQSMDGDDVDSDLASRLESEADPTSPPWIEAPWAALTRTGFATGVDAVDAARTSAASSVAPPPAPKDDGAGLRTAGYITFAGRF
jgi:hypothetical protein